MIIYKKYTIKFIALINNNIYHKNLIKIMKVVKFLLNINKMIWLYPEKKFIIKRITYIINFFINLL